VASLCKNGYMDEILFGVDSLGNPRHTVLGGGPNSDMENEVERFRLLLLKALLKRLSNSVKQKIRRAHLLHLSMEGCLF